MGGDEKTIHFNPIGVIRTPYADWAPNQPVEREQQGGKFRVIVDEKWTEALRDLEAFRYIMLIFHMNKVNQEPQTIVSPPWAAGRTAGMFATRTPNRPNPIGISIVRVEKIEGNVIYTWPVDVFDNTPLLDIKPYMKGLDSKEDANYGWLENDEGKEHIIQHIRGIAHDHGDDHVHPHVHDESSQGHAHSHEHVHDHSHDHSDDHQHQHDHDGKNGHSHSHSHQHSHAHDHGGDHRHDHDKE